MLGTLSVAALVCVASLIAGEAIARLLGAERWRGWSPAVGLAFLIAVALATIRLPDHGDAAAVALAVAALVALVAVATGGVPRPAWHVVGASAFALIAALVPYVANGRFGIPAVGYTNDPAAHLTWIAALQVVPTADAVTPGYPIGPHSLMAAIASGTGIEQDWVFAGTLVALPVLIAWAALALLDGLGPLRRVLAAGLVSVAYTVSAFYAQAGFKELLLTLFVLAGLGIARDEIARGAPTAWRSGAQIGLLCGALAVSFSYGGLAWPVAIGGVWVAAAIAVALVGPARRPPRQLVPDALRWARRLLPGAIVAAVVGALAVVSDLSRLLDSVTVFGAGPAGSGTITTENIGHLAGEISKRMIFGFWPAEDFRFGIGHVVGNEILFVVAVAAALYAGVWWLSRRDLAVPAAALATIVIAIRLSDTESAYTASKALAPAGAVVMLMTVRALLADRPVDRRIPRGAVLAVAVVFVASALWSSALALRGAEVGPRDHADQLAELRSEALGHEVLFLGHDDYAPWMLRGASALVLPVTRPEKQWGYGDPYDFDAVDPETLDRPPFVITPRTAYRSEPPPSLDLVRTTESFEIWRRTGTAGDRRVLPGEGSAPGAVLDCSRPAGRRLAARDGWARVWTAPPRFVPLPPRIENIPAGESRVATARLRPGRWEVSLQYFSRQRIDVSVDGPGDGAVPPYLGRPGPLFRAAEIVQPRADTVRVDMRVEDDRLGAKNHGAIVRAVAFVRLDAPRRTVPLREACGRYVDWYTLGAERPRV